MATTPFGVMLVSVLTMIYGLLMLLGGFLILPFALSILTGIVTLTDLLWFVIAILPILFGLLFLWIGWGLLNLRRSAFNWYIGLFLLSFLFALLEIFLYWQGWELVTYSGFVEYLAYHIQTNLWDIIGWIIGSIIFFYLLSKRYLFNGDVTRA